MTAIILSKARSVVWNLIGRRTTILFDTTVHRNKQNCKI